jgi:hypothetical protein
MYLFIYVFIYLFITLCIYYLTLLAAAKVM